MVLESKRPNLLILMADQHSAHLLSCAGATHVSTPCLDALAAAGTRFTRAYTTFPLCVPARASMVTGRCPHQLGIHGNKAAGEEPGRLRQSLGQLLRDRGYDTAYAGKWHALQPSVSAADGFEVVAPFGDRGLAAAASDWLRGRAEQERPFALIVSFDDPHSICEYARNQPMPYGQVDCPTDARDLPPLPANHGRAAYEPQALRAEQARAEATYGTSRFGPDDWRRYRHVYARLIERTDAAVGEVLDALEIAGRSDDTVVVYTSDHGDGDASHEWNQKTALFEETCRVPLIVRDPRGSTGRPTTSALVSVGLDLLPTALAVAQGGAPTADGLDLLEVARSAVGHDQVVVETHFARSAGSGTSGRAVVCARYKYVVYGWGAHREQLFDLQADPGELRNLAAESVFDPLLEQMRHRMLDWCLDTRDTTFLKRLALPADAPSEVHQEIFDVPY
ncbi:sulfatase family protein [Leekyejoonella antrihumi]|uniref:Sulfatase n=1 Tax=Leekyejoonella antrihumi TaxID=1660198 RepID=A0A563DWP8_9MICO|nr:sulfatase-like hydrolase/transferase [Leekyejoonella antrihumi]TWP34124.1 sulfatase [Leekyejoonella antrihumi]